MTEPEQISEAEQLAVPVWMHRLASKIVLGNHGVGNAGVLIQRAFEEQTRELREALASYSEDQECGYCECLVSSGALARQALATRQDAPVTENSHEQ